MPYKDRMARRRPSLEQDWRAAVTATALLSLLFPDHRTPETAGVRRKLRLVLCGAARTVWDRLPHDDLRAAVEVAERFADDRATRRELIDALQLVVRRQNAARHADPVPLHVGVYRGQAAELARACCERSVTVARICQRTLNDCPKLAAPLAVWEAAVPTDWDGVEVGPDPAAAVVRDIFGGPTPARFAAEWRTATVTAIAAGIAADAAFDRLPVLADALEDAGCESLLVLAHCRGPGPHWRGCWVVDGLLRP